MIPDPSSQPESGNRLLDGLIARFLSAEEAGAPFDLDGELRENRIVAAAFQEFLQQHRGLLQANQPTETFLRPAPSPPSPDLAQPGQIIGDCRILREVGRGGMGVVYQAQHVRVHDLRAIKVLPRNRVTDHSIRRFEKEARAAAAIGHLNVIAVHDVGQLENLHYIVMQYVEGDTLAGVLDRHQLRNPGVPLPWRTALQLSLPVLEALAAMHRKSLVHRDIKPSNIMVTEALSRRHHVLLMDFGLVQDERDESLTEAGAIVGTPPFMSPEQARGDPLDGRTDIYSVGATVYYLLCGRPPFQGRRHDVCQQVASGALPDSLAQLRPDIPPAVCQTIRKAMAPDRKQRYRRAEELLNDWMTVLRQKAPRETAATKGGAGGDQPMDRNPPPAPADFVPPQAVPPAAAHDTIAAADTWPDRAPTAWLEVPSGVGSKGESAPLLLPAPKKRQLALLFETSRGAQAGLAAMVLVGLGVCLLLLARPSDRVSPSAKDGTPGVRGEKSVVATSSAAGVHGMILIPSGNVWLGAGTETLRAHAESLATINGNAVLIAQFVDLCDDVPRTRVTVPAFWMDEYEVTNQRYADFVRESGHPRPIHWTGDAPPTGMESHPVTQVSFQDASAYAAWAGKQLPTEAQWLRAFRGESEHLYPWGDKWRGELANTAQNRSFAVGTSAVENSPLDRSPLGVHNLVGNVSELIRDRANSNGQAWCVVKGSDTGSNGDIFGVAPARRLISPDDTGQVGVGFRCVLEEPAR